MRVGSGDRTILELYRDGTLIFSCRADDCFLAWASPRGKERLNPLALVEITFNFVDFYRYVLDDHAERPTGIQVRVDFQNLHLGGQKTSLLPHGLGTYAQLLEIEVHDAPDNDASLVRRFRAEAFEPATAAYAVTREIYLWFGIDEDKIPYVRRDLPAPRVDVDAIRNSR